MLKWLDMTSWSGFEVQNKYLSNLTHVKKNIFYLVSHKKKVRIFFTSFAWHVCGLFGSYIINLFFIIKIFVDSILSLFLIIRLFWEEKQNCQSILTNYKIISDALICVHNLVLSQPNFELNFNSLKKHFRPPD